MQHLHRICIPVQVCLYSNCFMLPVLSQNNLIKENKNSYYYNDIDLNIVIFCSRQGFWKPAGGERHSQDLDRDLPNAPVVAWLLVWYTRARLPRRSWSSVWGSTLPSSTSSSSSCSHEQSPFTWKLPTLCTRQQKAQKKEDAGWKKTNKKIPSTPNPPAVGTEPSSEYSSWGYQPEGAASNFHSTAEKIFVKFKSLKIISKMYQLLNRILF